MLQTRLPTAVGSSRCKQTRSVRPVVVRAAASDRSVPEPAYIIKKVTFFDAMKFAGPAPEIINGRLAMVGLVAAAMQEAETGRTALWQLAHGPWQAYVLAAVVAYASLVPILKAVKNEAFGIFSPRAETANARAAMLGWGILLALEWRTGVPFF